MLIKDLPQEIQEKISKLEINNKKSKKDITGNIYSHLTVIGRGPDYIKNNHTNSQWWCVCDCPEHNILLVRISNLTSGNTKSCGCQKKISSTNTITRVGYKMAKDISNQQFGELLALYPTEERKNGSVIWQCLCSCGQYHKVSFHDLYHNRITSCGCKRYKSKGIRIIEKLLQNNNIFYITEKTFQNFRFKDTNGIPRFDFYINNNFLLEYDGEQHFYEKDTKYFKDTLQKRQEHDKIKNEWCKQNNIILKRISYKDIANLTIEDILGDKYII